MGRNYKRFIQVILSFFVLLILPPIMPIFAHNCDHIQNSRSVQKIPESTDKNLHKKVAPRILPFFKIAEGVGWASFDPFLAEVKDYLTFIIPIREKHKIFDSGISKDKKTSGGSYLEHHQKLEDRLLVKNTSIEKETVNITGRKIWVLGPDIKPIIQLQLYRNGLAYGDPVELLDGETAYTWIGLEKVDSNGRVYSYTIDEVSTPENYDKVISEDGLTISNYFYELSGAVVQEDVENLAVENKPVTGFKAHGFLYTMIIVLSSLALIFFAKRESDYF